MQEIAKKWLVEQHKNNQDKAHIYFYSPIPFPKKPADSVIGLEIKGSGEHGIAFCFPSIHKDGHQYEIVGTNQSEVLSELQATQLIQHINQVCLKHGLLDLAVLDIRMPKMNGFQLYRRLRKIDRKLTATELLHYIETDSDIIEDLGSGCFISKPVNNVDIINKLSQSCL